MPSAIATPPPPFTVAAHFFQLLTDYTERHGLTLAHLRELTEISDPVLVDANGRVAYVHFQRFCDAAALALNAPSLGLALGQSVRPGHLGSHGIGLMSCATALELAQQSVRYSALTIDAGHNEVTVRGNEFVRVWCSNLPGGASMGRLQDELQHAVAVTLVRWLTNREELNPNWVSFQHARPADTQPYDALFRCPIRFGAAETAIAMDMRYMTLPLPQANPQVRRIMEDLCAQLLKQLGDAVEPAWLSTVRRATLEAFRHGMPDIEAVAHAASMAPTDLKDQLATRGLSFRSLVDDLRRALAMGYMRDPTLGLVDIAYLLGFSEQSAFQRAFKRWTGQTPGEYRRLPDTSQDRPPT